MSDSEIYLKGACQNCAGHIEFPMQAAGTTVVCPHCGAPTLLEALPSPASTPAKTKQAMWFILGVVLVFASLAGWRVAEHLPVTFQTTPKSIQNQPPPAVALAPPPPPDPWHGLMAGPITLAKAEQGDLVYAVGTLRNESDHERYGVKVEINLFDAQDDKIESSTDYSPTITPGKVWKFRALVINRKAVRAEIAKVTEEK